VLTGTGAASVYDGTRPLDDGHWYRTGDRVRTESGELVHLGRLDRQVQVAGARVELGEIEAVLRAHPAVRDAAVVMRPDGRTIAAFYTGSEVPAADLRATMRRRLPGYMVPVEYHWLPVMPLSANGKVDRRGLPVSSAGH
jgi:acyl-coenzyme A synthetase/AMP-(fatty) acid ligase